MESEIIVRGLTQLELRELEEKLGSTSVKVVDGADGNFREPLTLIVAAIALSSLALNAITLIATRPTKTSRRSITIEHDVGGERRSFTFSEETKSSDAPQPKQIEEIGKALHIDLKSLASIAKPE
ncbi:hypothetical protein MXD81_31330 [Microbacteriaceae bacterium K1510]|nr:hypothetical protein [Microbacteriaceae bacterium K1510]